MTDDFKMIVFVNFCSEADFFNRILFWNKLTLTSTVASIKHWLNGQDWRLVIVSKLKYGEFNQIKL